MSTSSASSNILGIVLLTRHGDRTEFFQDPNTYVASNTEVTPLGTQQEFQLGGFIRNTYFEPNRPNSIQGFDLPVNMDQIKVRADAGDEGGVIFQSTVAATQGMFPPTPEEKTTLANGTTITAPLGGYEYVSIESVEANQDVSLEGYADCTTWTNRIQEVYNSTLFQQRAQQAAPFLQAVKPFIGNRSDTLEDAFNIFDYLNVNSIHNATFLHELPPTFLAQAHELANFHEFLLFSDPSPSGIGNIAAQTILPTLISAMQSISNASNPLKFHYSGIAYKPFISLFNVTFSPPSNPEDGGIVNYAAALVFELHQAGSGVNIVAKFKNGSDDNTFHTLSLKPELSTLDGFISTLAPIGINNTLEWCNACDNHVDRGCSAFFPNTSAPAARSLHARSLPSTMNSQLHGASGSHFTAGLLGAGMMLIVVLFFNRLRSAFSSQSGLHRVD